MGADFYFSTAKLMIGFACALGGFAIMVYYKVPFWPRLAVYILFCVASVIFLSTK